MHLSHSMVGVTIGPIQHEVDAGWLSAYASATGASPKREAHPVFPVCYEWPALLAMRANTVPETIHPRGVHATHDMTIHRPPRPRDRLSTTARVVRVEARKPGAYVLARLETVDQSGQPVTTTEYGSLYLGVEVEDELANGSGANAGGKDGAATPRPQGLAVAWQAEVPVARNLAHVYSESSRIWNPIHTDHAVAVQAGLPDTILHGTATLALAVSQVLEHEAEPLGGVRRIACRFGGMVFMPSTLVVQGSRRDVECYFQVLNQEGRPAVDRGVLSFAAEKRP